MSGRPPAARADGHSLGQHFLRSAGVAARLVADAAIVPTDTVVDLGAGSGALTTAIADCGARVLAVEIDRALSAGLAQRCAGRSNITLFSCDVLTFPLPSTPYRVLANVPFSRTSAIVHRLLDDPMGALVRADLVVQWQVARSRAQSGCGAALDLVGAQWGPWWTFGRGRRLPRRLFRPSPAVDAAVLTISRRVPPLLPETCAADYVAFVRANFARAHTRRDLAGWVRGFRRG
ncbi:MAG TPA: rRNA adenine N-6-methyltransferase family protein [Acidimicrobiia bacterium]